MSWRAAALSVVLIAGSGEAVDLDYDSPADAQPAPVEKFDLSKGRTFFPTLAQFMDLQRMDIGQRQEALGLPKTCDPVLTAVVNGGQVTVTVDCQTVSKTVPAPDQVGN